jgi:hypothetical protein
MANSGDYHHFSVLPACRPITSGGCPEFLVVRQRDDGCRIGSNLFWEEEGVMRREYQILGREFETMLKRIKAVRAATNGGCSHDLRA